MAKYLVKSIYKDGVTGQVHYPGEEVDITDTNAKKFPAGIIEKFTGKKANEVEPETGEETVEEDDKEETTKESK
ncbi:hypothetical protein AAK938_01320 [Aerococcaceae bacterium 50-4]